jgi:methyl-accepting chemotaxis protein
MKRKKLMTKILASISIPIMVVYVVTAALIARTSGSALSKATEESLTAESQAASYQIENYLSKYTHIVQQLNLEPYMQSFIKNAANSSDVQAVPGIDEINEALGNIINSDKDNIVDAWVAVAHTKQIIDKNSGISSNYDMTSRPWYSGMEKNKNAIITDPYEDVSTKTLIVSMIVPFLDDSGSIIGVASVDITLDQLYNTIKSYKLGSGGFYILTSSDGKLVYYPDASMKNKSVKDSKMSQNVIDAISGKKSGYLTYSAVGNTNYGYVSPVGSTGWTVTTGLPESEFKSSSNAVLWTLVVMFAVAIVIMLVVIVIVSKGIVRPLEKLKGAADRIAYGDLDVTIDVKSSDEVGQVADSLSRTVDRLKKYIVYIDEVAEALDKIAVGDLTFKLKYDYAGEFAKIKKSLVNIKSTLVSTLKGINASAEQVAAGSGQVSDASQSLAQGATEQASSVQELSATVTEISHDVSKNAENAASADSLARVAAEESKNGKELMHQMNEAMISINDSSNQINKIIKTIQDIAFQTNILALNAAVEAARAGAAGKGFTVVAEEVRNLAGKSAEAAKATTELVENEINSVKNGSVIAEKTAKSLDRMILAVGKAADAVGEISKASADQAGSIKQVTEGLDQISAVVQTNSATAEESAASSEELNGQAQLLKELLLKFKIDG